MFEFVRTHTRLLQFLLVLLVFPSFVFFGIQGYSRFTEGNNATVAKVDGHPITRAEWDVAHQRQVERIRRQAPNVDAKMFDTPEMRRQTLDGLVRERVLLAAVHDLHLGVSDERLQRTFASDPQFAFLRNPDGSVNKDILAAQGMSSEMLAQQLRQDLSVRQVLQGVSDTVISTAADARTALDALLQRREVQVQRFDTSDYLAKVSPSDADLEAYYKAHESEFRAPEQATIEYVVLDLDTLKKGVTVPEDELKKYYEQNLSRYTTPEERHAAHILIKAEKDMPAAERAKAKARAEQVLAEVRANPGAFADLAKKYSEDPGSKEQGGDLGFFNREAMVKPFADTAFSMKPGEISGLVETDFGYHVIKLIESRGGERKPFAEVRAGIEDEVKKQLAQRRYAEAAEQFTNTVYEQSDSLQPVIDKLKLEKKTATVQHQPMPPGNGPLSSAKFIDGVFGNDPLRNKRNTDAIEFGPNQLAAARVQQYTPARVLPFAEVKDRVRQRVVTTQAATLARKEGDARLAQLKKGGDSAGLGAPIVISRTQTNNLPPEVVNGALGADPAKLPVDVGVELGDQGYVVIRVAKVLPADPASEEMKALQPRYGQAWAAAEGQAYYEALKSRFKAEIKDAAKLPASDSASAPQR
ncbi:MAG TPA: SurA N-terminal domain-containing protein [Burkholderiaceae bacterium]|nr:SurA N-terminal domain-containing protein [Burkholderiaceae bacterium]